MRVKKLHTNLMLLILLFSAQYTFAEMRNSISQYGITWTFNGQYECGQFVTGDWWVVGPVTINSVSPGQTPGRNGSVVNPIGGKHAYDNRSYPGAASYYDASLRPSFPLTMQANQSLVSSKSKPESVTSFKNVGTLNDQAVLTVVASPQPSGTFRPGYAGTYKRYFNISQIYGLPSVAAPPSTPSGSNLAAYTDRPRIDHYGTWVIQFGCAENNWNNGILWGEEVHKCYGQQYSEMLSQAGLYAMLDVPDKMQVAYNLIQIGIDNYSVLRTGGGWGADGGHHSARIFPIVFAAKLLGDPDMLNVGIDYSGKFGENNQTYYGNNGKPLWGKAGVATYFLNGCSGSGAKDVRDPAHIVDGCPDYRDMQTSRTWPGQMLAALMIHAQDIWGHDAYFDYVDRWMAGGVNSSGSGSGGNAFVNEMWDWYYNNIPPIDPVPVTGVSVSPTFLPIEEGMISQLTKIIEPVNATNKSVTWSSSNTSIATVDVNGVVSALSVGQATITATTNDGGFTATCDVEVSSIGTNLALNKSISVSAFQDNTDGYFPDGNLVDGDVTDDTRWSASGFPQWAEIDLGTNSDISRIDVFPYQNRPYQYIVEAKTDGGSYSTIVNRGSNAEGLDVLTDMVSTSARYIKITVSGISGGTSTWVSLAEMKVYGETGDPVEVTGVSIDPASLTLEEGASSDLTETVLPSNATDKTVTWASSNSAIATVDGNGMVTAIDEGSCTITVQTNDGNFTANCAVNINPAPEGDFYYCSPTGSMSNSGTSPSSPWANLETVASQKTFPDGAVIYLMDGNHGFPVITEDNNADVTITKYQGANPILDRIKFSGATHWVLKDVEIHPANPFPEAPALQHPVGPKFNNTMIQVSATAHLTIDGVYAYSIENSAGWSANDWNYKAWNATYIDNNSDDVLITDCYFKNVNFGYYAVGNSTNQVFQNSTVENFCGDGIRPDCNYTIVQNNVIKNCYLTNGNHDDMLQIYRGSAGAVGVVIRDNKFINNTDPNQPLLGEAQGIALFDGMFVDLVIENNLVVANHWHGITLLGATNCRVVNNTVVDINNVSPGPAWIQIEKHKDGRASTGNIIRNNICTSMNNASNIGSVDHNQVISWSQYSSYFTNYAVFDYSLKAGSPAINVGSATSAPATDITGLARPQGGAFDIGCYEYIGSIIPVTGVSLSPTVLSIEEDQSVALSATIEPSNATYQTVTWSSDNPAIATVDANGVVLAQSGGQAIITVTTNDGGYTDNCSVTVSTVGTNLALNKSITVSAYQDDSYGHYPGEQLVDGDVSDGSRWAAAGFPQTAEIDLGADYVLSRIDLFPYQNRAYQYIIESKSDGGAYSTLIDRSSNTVGEDKLTDLISASARYLKLTVTGISGSTSTWVSLAELKVYGGGSPEPVSSVSVSPTSLQLAVGENSTIVATVLPSNAANKTVLWSSDNTSIATVDNNGLVTGIGTGSCSIRATSDGNNTIYDECIITVIQPQYETISIEAEDYTGMSGCSVGTAHSGFSGTGYLDYGGTSTYGEWGAIDGGSSGNTTLKVRYGNGGTAARPCNVLVNGQVIASLNFSESGDLDWTNWMTETITLALDPGAGNTIRIIASTSAGGPNLDYLELTTETTQCNTPVSSISVDVTSTILEVGGTIALSETVLPADACDKSVAWSSSDAGVATVDATGLVSALNSGACTITATSVDNPSATAICQVTVAVPVSSVSVSPFTSVLAPGQNISLSATVLPANATDNSISWSSDNVSVATVDQSGNVTAISLGTAIISVTTNDGNYSAACTITVNDAPPVPTNVALGKTVTESAYQNSPPDVYPGANVVDGDASDASRWSASSFPQWVEIDLGSDFDVSEIQVYTYSSRAYQYIVESRPESGTYSSLVDRGSNTSTVQPITDAVSATARYIKITVTGASGYTGTWVSLTEVVVMGVPAGDPVAASGISVSPTTLSLSINESSSLNAIVSPSDASNQQVSWSSDNLSVATVDANGVVSALSDGLANITVTTTDGGFTASCVITVVGPTYLIEENFSASTSDFSQPAGGTWAVSSGKYALTNPIWGGDGLLGNISIHNTEVTGDFELSTSINITGTTSAWNDAAVVFNYQDINNHYYVSINESNDGYSSGVFKVVNGTPTEIYDITTLVSSDTDYVLEVSKSGSNIVVYLDGTQIATVSDATFTGGKVGYGSKNDGAVFDNLLVSASGGAKHQSDKQAITSGNSSNLKVNIFPNPAIGPGFNVDVSGMNNMYKTELRIIDLTGRLIYTELFNAEGYKSVYVPTNGIQGMFIVSVKNGNNMKNTYIIVK